MKLFNRKAQGLSMNVIIIAALALTVLIVLVFVFASKMGVFRENTESCSSRGGTCFDQRSDTCKGPVFKTDDCTKCCIPLTSPTSGS